MSLTFAVVDLCEAWLCLCPANIDLSHVIKQLLSVLVDFTGTGYFPLLPDGLLSGGGLVLLQLPKNLSLDHQHLQVGFFLLFQGPSAPSRIHSVSKL